MAPPGRSLRSTNPAILGCRHGRARRRTKKKGARRARAAGHAHACMHAWGFFSPVRLCPHSPLSSHIRTYGRSISAASIQTVPNIIDQRASLPRTYVQYILVCCCEKKHKLMHIMDGLMSARLIGCMVMNSVGFFLTFSLNETRCNTEILQN